MKFRYKRICRKSHPWIFVGILLPIIETAEARKTNRSTHGQCLKPEAESRER